MPPHAHSQARLLLRSLSLRPITYVSFVELTGGTLAAVVPLHTSSLLFLLGGGRSPLYPPNKVILWDDAIGSEVAELEFRERVRGLACRRGWLSVALRRRVVVFQIGDQVTRFGEWDTCDNPRGEYLGSPRKMYNLNLHLRFTRHCHWRLCYLACHSWSANGSCAISASPSMSSSYISWSTIFITTT